MEKIKTKNLSFTYPDSNTPALDSVNIKINEGELVLLAGRSGSGKSTLLKLLVKDIAPYGDMLGELILNASSVAYVSQCAENTFVSETVRGELAFSLENKCLSNEEISIKIGELASFFNINDILDKRVHELSGGEKSTLAIAAAMSADADILLLDEPLAQLDPKAVSQVISLIKRVNDELGTTIIIASHILDGIIDMCSKAVFLEGGRVSATGDPEVLKKNDSLLIFFPEYTALFDERPLTVKKARECEFCFAEKAVQEIPLSSEKSIEIKNVSFAYKKELRDVFSNLNLTVRQGELHCIIGANGSGKTTLLKLISGIKKPYSGKIRINGKCAYVPQNVKYLFTKDKVVEEIREDTAKAFLLDRLLNRHPYDISGGEQQLLAISKVSEQGFDILLLDEPVKSLDKYGKKLVTEYIMKIKEQGKTIVIVTHDLEFAGDIADRVTFLSDGVAAMSDSRQNVFTSLNYYTTQIRRITRSYLKHAVSREDLI